jgi:hypothetical protein
MKLFSMQLSEENQSIKKNLYNFLDGKFDEELEILLGLLSKHHFFLITWRLKMLT